MQNQQNQTKKSKKKKRALVYKPYVKGNACDGRAVRYAFRVMLYFFLIAFLYIIAGSVMQFKNTALRVGLNAVMVLLCAMIVYMDGARLGDAEVAFGEIAYSRREAGKALEKKDLERCYHPLKGVVIALIAAIPVVLLTLPHALTAQKQTYVLQSLPNWVSAYGRNEEIALPLQYYNQQSSFSVMDLLRVVSRVLIFPFANIATVDNKDALLLADRLSPILACLPLLGFPVGYLTGPRSRALVHGDISANIKRQQRRQRKAVKARQARAPKKNELV